MFNRVKILMAGMICVLCLAGCVKVVGPVDVGSSDTIKEEEPVEETTVYAAYAEKVKEYEEKYGSAKVEAVDEYYSYMKGLCFIKLVDFAKNGREQLLLVYQVDNPELVSGDYTYEIWGYEKDGMILMDSGELFVTDGGVHYVYLTEVEGENYLITGNTDDFGNYYYHGCHDGEFAVVRSVSWTMDANGDMTGYINERPVSEEEVRLEQEKWLKNATKYDLNFETDTVLEAIRQTKQILGFEEEKSDFTEVTDYIGNIPELVNVLGMEEDTEEVYHNGYSSHNDDFEVSWDEKEGSYYVLNRRRDDVSAYGVRLAMPRKDVISLFGEKENSCREVGENSDIFYILSKGQVITLHVVYKNELVSEYSFDNYESSEQAETARTVLELGERYDLKNQESWKSAYVKFIFEQGITEETLTGICEEYKLINIDGDAVPELYINFGYSAGGSMVATYYNNQIVFERMDDYGFYYLKGEKLMLSSGGSMDVYYDIVYKMENGEFAEQGRGNYGAEDNTAVQYDVNGNPIYNYYWNGIQVSGAAQYKEALRKVFDKDRSINPNYEDTEDYGMSGLFSYTEIIEQIATY